MFRDFRASELEHSNLKGKGGKALSCLKLSHIIPAESQKGVNTVQCCSLENQKGAITIPLVQQ